MGERSDSRIRGEAPVGAALEALRESEERFRRFFENAPAAFAMFDREMRYVAASRRWRELRELGDRELKGLFLYEVFPEIPEAWKEVHRRALAGETTRADADRVVRDDGTVQWLRWEVQPWHGLDGNVAGIVIASEDVTQRKQAQLRLDLLAHTASELLRTDSPQRLVDALCHEVMDYVGCDAFFNFLADEATGRLRLNAYAGISAEDARAMEWIDYGGPICGCVAQQGVPILIEDICRNSDPRVDIVRAQGIQVCAGFPLKTHNRVLGTVSFGARARPRFSDDDLSLMKVVADQVATAMERKRYEQELLAARETAEAANRAKSEFLARMSHEIRTPIHGFMGMTQLALTEPLSPHVRQYLTYSKSSATQLLRIVNDILDLARIEARSVELVSTDFDLRETVDAVFSTLGALAREKGLLLDREIDRSVPRTVRGDPGRLSQVLFNLVGNAIKFTAKGLVSFSISRADGPNGRGTARLLFSVADTGIGISSDRLATIFDSYSQASASHHAEFGGTGLGLSIARELVMLMGGRLWAESEVGVGSTFLFSAEFETRGEEGDTAAHVPPVDWDAPQGSRRARILVAEDDHVSQYFVAEALRRLGHEVVVAGNGREALDALAHEIFDLVFMDIRMPELDGLAAAREVREGRVPGVPQDLPIIALTAHALKGDREYFLESGLDDYLSKPVDTTELEQMVARWTGGRGSAKEGGAEPGASTPVPGGS